MKIFFGVLLIIISQMAKAQSSTNSGKPVFDPSETEAHLRYIASDELQGRRTASEGGDKAAAYIADKFKAYGVKQIPGATGYFQPIPFEEILPPLRAELYSGAVKWIQGENLLLIKGQAGEWEAEAVFAGHGWVNPDKGIDDYAGVDVKGKIVFVLPGKPDTKDPMETFEAMSVKPKLAAERGAIALFELYRMNFPWQFFRSYFGKERLALADTENNTFSKFVYGWVKESVPNPLVELEAGQKLSMRFITTGMVTKKLFADNVVGMVEGTDPAMKEEYLLLSAHYDHVGIGKQGGMPYSKQDSIFNGARDNGFGTTALLAAAKELATNPPRRSVIFLACTGEELGLLGSRWYADHPLVPLEKTVFNLNNDGAGYNSLEHISIIGWGYTNADQSIQSAARENHLGIVENPVPEQNLYERSDNFSFARKGIPAVCFSPGVTEMNEAIFKYYHQAADNPDTVDFDYLYRFCKAFAHTARKIAEMPERPKWMPGNKFETR